MVIDAIFDIVPRPVGHVQPVTGPNVNAVDVPVVIIVNVLPHLYAQSSWIHDALFGVALSRTIVHVVVPGVVVGAEVPLDGVVGALVGGIVVPFPPAGVVGVDVVPFPPAGVVGGDVVPFPAGVVGVDVGVTIASQLVPLKPVAQAQSG